MEDDTSEMNGSQNMSDLMGQGPDEHVGKGVRVIAHLEDTVRVRCTDGTETGHAVHTGRGKPSHVRANHTVNIKLLSTGQVILSKLMLENCTSNQVCNVQFNI